MKALNKKIMFSVFNGLVMSLSHATEAEKSYIQEIHFSEVSNSYLDRLNRYKYVDVSSIDKRLSKDEIHHIWSNPQFSNGNFIVKPWNYVLDILNTNSSKCQLDKVFYRQYDLENKYEIKNKCKKIFNNSKKLKIKTYQNKLFELNIISLLIINGELVFEFKKKDKC